MSKLKSCPFCGSTPEIDRLQDTSLHIVTCHNCGCHTPWESNSLSLWENRTRHDTSLKPCPLCGHKAKTCEYVDGTFYVQCQKCWTSTEEFLNRDAAIDAWNRRENHD